MGGGVGVSEAGVRWGRLATPIKLCAHVHSREQYRRWRVHSQAKVTTVQLLIKHLYHT